MKFQALPYYLSQYFWILYIITPLIFTFFIPKKSKSVIIHSSKTKFNNSKDPIVFAQLSDTHINTLRPKSIETFRQTIKLVQSYSPEFIIHTGDIVDNYDSTSFPRYGVQSEANWEVYKKETSLITDIPIIEVGGNHDMFGVKDALSKGNYIIDSSHLPNRNNTVNRDNFLVHSFRVGPSQTNIIAINPFNFPTPHAPLIMTTTFTKHLLNLIENEIEKSDTKSILISHYPIASIHSKKSSKGRTFTDIIDSKETVIGYLSGHWHPRKPSIFYQKNGGIEIIGTVTFREGKFGLATIDNDAISWSLVDFSNQPAGAISYPIPISQVTSGTIFNDREDAEIRVVMFTEENDLKIEFTIKDISDQKTVFTDFLNYKRRLVNGHSLYTYPMAMCSLRTGSYRIIFEGDFNGTSDFLIDDQFESKGKRLGYFTGVYAALPYVDGVYIAILLICTFFVRLNFFDFQTKLDQIEEWIETSEGGFGGYWFISIFLGFLLIRTRFLQMPLSIKMFVFACVLFAFVGPLLFFETEGALGIIWIYGYVVDRKILPSDYGLVYAIFYLAAICSPMVLLASNFGVRNRSSWLIGDFVVGSVCAIGDVLIILRIVHESVGPKLTAASFGFVILPSAFIAILLAWLFAFRDKKQCCGNAGINDNSESSILMAQQSQTDQ
ncbi:Transmembrane protein 62 [Tritrichomonas musculus]|uniref:Transmembrane protein 62 n=1 Tax=Tritrichomonas musculus TaxID=1915356 RepID=A0ABR2GW68_9EUKA